VKCVICNHRKGRRECPALEGLICTQCCGSKRGLEIRCPDDCDYFGQALARLWFDLFHPAWARIKEEDKRRKLLDSVNTCFPLILLLQRTLLRAALEVSDPRDEFILEALKLLEEGYRARAGGIIYEPSSTKLQVRTMVRETREKVSREEEEARIPPEVLAESFLIMFLFAEEYTSGQQDGESFFRLLRRFHPTLEDPETKSGGIIITG